MIGALERERPTLDTVARALLAAGCITLAVRSLAPVSIVATALVGVLGLIVWRPAARARVDALRWLAVVGAGCAMFAATLALGAGRAPERLTVSLAAAAIAAIAEEAFFRRAMYGFFERAGAAVAIAVTALLFGLIHAPIYGWTIVPLDIAAGIVLGWQRWASGTWTAPAVTHLVANLVMFL